MDEKSDVSDGSEIDIDELKEEQTVLEDEQDLDFEMEQGEEEEVEDEPITDLNNLVKSSITVL